MPWVPSHTTLREHPKRKRLSRLLGLNAYEAVGLLHVLWWWVLDFAPEGDLRPYSDEDIADAIDFDGDAAALVAALTRSGFVDADRRVHDWDEYAEKWIARRAANAERMRKARDARNGEPDSAFAHAARTSGARPAQTPECVGLPDLPDRTNIPTGPDLPDLPPSTLTLPPATEREGGNSALPRAFPPDVITVLSALPADLDAGGFHTAAETALGGLGFKCSRERRVADRGDGHAGRLDLVAERHGVVIALELDDRVPRQKSIAKLASALSCDFRAVVLRCPADGPLPFLTQITVIGAGRDPHAPSSPPTPAGREHRSAERRRPTPALVTRYGREGCPAGCATNHGGPKAANHLGADWLAVPPAERPPWPEYLARHGRGDLADLPAPDEVHVVIFEQASVEGGSP